MSCGGSPPAQASSAASPSPPPSHSVREGIAEAFTLARFSPRQYLDHYWPESHMDGEDKFIMRFLHEAYSAHRPSGGLLELGGGPVVDKYISASRFVSHVVHTDFSEDALREVSLFRDHRPEAWDWRLRGDFAAALERQEEEASPTPQPEPELAIAPERQEEEASPPPQPEPEPGAAVLQRVRERLGAGSLRRLDLRRAPADCDIPAEELARIGVVSAHSVCECATRSEDEWRVMLGNVLSFCAPGVLLVMTANTNSTFWAGGSGAIGAVPVAPETIVEAVRAAGFADIRTELRREGDPADTEMTETFALSAVRR